MDTSKVVLAGLAGLAAGAVLGVLLAPEKGSRTRKHIINKGNEYAEDATDKFNDVLESITDKYESLLKDVERMSMKAKAKFNDAKRDIHEATA
jgi:gas vesicle protein